MRQGRQPTSRPKERKQKLEIHQSVPRKEDRRDNRVDDEAARRRKRRNRGGRTTSLNPKTKTENNSNAQDAERQRIHADFSNVQNAIWGELHSTKLNRTPDESETKVRQK